MENEIKPEDSVYKLCKELIEHMETIGIQRMHVYVGDCEVYIGKLKLHPLTRVSDIKRDMVEQ